MRMTPKTDHSAKPVTVTAYIRFEIAPVSPVRIIFHACGRKLVMEQSDAAYPTMSAPHPFSALDAPKLAERD